jgi:uncharacterized protein (TIGR00290 family)
LLENHLNPHPISASSKTKAVFVWSGGKDSALALYKIKQHPAYEVIYLLTTVSQKYQRVTMHGIRTTLLVHQAQALGIPLRQVILPENPDMATYNQLMAEAFIELKMLGVTAAVFGDIFLADLRAYREQQMTALGLAAVFPLWHIPTSEVMKEFISLKFKAVLVCLNARYFPQAFGGRAIDDNFLRDLPPGVDACGENGEYHSFVYDGPLFSAPVPFTTGKTVARQYTPAAKDRENEVNASSYDHAFWFTDLQ